MSSSPLLKYVFPSLGIVVATAMFVAPLKAVEQAKADAAIGVQLSPGPSRNLPWHLRTCFPYNHACPSPRASRALMRSSSVCRPSLASMASGPVAERSCMSCHPSPSKCLCRT